MSKVRIASLIGAVVLAMAALAGCNHTHPHPGPTPAPTATAPTTRPTPSHSPTGSPTTAHPSVSPSSTPPVISVEQRNAARTATDYLDGQSFSRKGLIKQLAFEGYSTKASTAAVDSLHVDWNAQAVLVAKNYLDDQAFSRKGLISQLEFEGFSATQAAHGVKGAGL